MNCSELGCDKPIRARGLCGMHYQRERYGKTPRRSWSHGTGYAYGRKGCRCSECVAWHRSKAEWDRLRAQQSPVKHGTYTGYAVQGCRCDECTEYRRLRARKEYAAAPDAARSRSRDAKKAQNVTTQDGATNRNKEWTGAELEIVVTRTDLTLAQLAGMLGRSYAAVQCARTRATKDPKWVNVAGVGESALQ